LNAPRLVFTSVIRGAALRETSGIVGVVDLERREVVSRSPVPESEHRANDPNPRGGVRGARGVAASGDRLVVANSDRLLVFDAAWSLVCELSHPWLGGIHDVALDPDGVWVSAANADLVAKIAPDGAILDRWSWRDDPELAGRLGFRSLPRFPEDVDYRDPRALQGGVHNIAHVNSVARGEGSVLVSLGRILPAREVARRRLKARAGSIAAKVGVVRRDRPPRSGAAAGDVPGSTFALVEVPDDRARGARVLVHGRGVSVPNHNVLRNGRDLIYNDSNLDRLVVWSLDEGRVRVAVALPGERPFARGLARLADGLFVVGSQRPARVHLIDLDAARIVESVDLGGDPREAVYAVCVVPDAFGEPPRTLSFEVSDD